MRFSLRLQVVSVGRSPAWRQGILAKVALEVSLPGLKDYVDKD